MTATATAPAAPPTGLINLTPAAVKKIRELLATQDDGDQMFLRLGVRGGGCSGFSYVLDLDQDVDEKYDRTFEIEGVKVVVDRKSLLFLAGTTLDYTGDLHLVGEGGFTFINPNATKGCGCGTSFSA
jgi:iron-sulfur cluster assembly accessory protein